MDLGTKTALLLIQNTTIKKFMRFVEPDRIDFIGMKEATISHSDKFLVGLAAHLYDPYSFDVNIEGMFRLDPDNKKWAILALMARHEIHPQSIINLNKPQEN